MLKIICDVCGEAGDVAGKEYADTIPSKIGNMSISIRVNGPKKDICGKCIVVEAMKALENEAVRVGR